MDAYNQMVGHMLKVTRFIYFFNPEITTVFGDTAHEYIWELIEKYVVVVVNWPPVIAAWPNHEVVDFLYRSVTTLNLVSVAYCYVAIIPVPPVRPSYCYTSIQGRVRLLPHTYTHDEVDDVSTLSSKTE